MNKVIKIAIPSYKRPNSVLILNSIPQSYKDNTYLFVRREELEEYSQNYSHKCNIIPLDNVTCISDTRLAIINYFGNDRIWLTYDDNKIHVAEYLEEKKIIRPNTKNVVNEEQFYDCMEYINEIMDKGYSHGLLRLVLFARGGNYWPYRVNCYGFTNVFFDFEKIKKSEVPYLNEVELLEDLYVFLSLVDKGYDNCMISKYMVSSSPANSPGGCSVRRNTLRTNRAVEKIANTFPKYVKIRQKARYQSNNVNGEEQLKGLTVRVPNKK